MSIYVLRPYFPTPPLSSVSILSKTPSLKSILKHQQNLASFQPKNIDYNLMLQPNFNFDPLVDIFCQLGLKYASKSFKLVCSLDTSYIIAPADITGGRILKHSKEAKFKFRKFGFGSTKINHSILAFNVMLCF